MFVLLLLLLLALPQGWLVLGAARYGSNILPQLKIGVERKNQQIIAPGELLFLLPAEGILPYETVEIRISHLSLPPAKFTIELINYTALSAAEAAAAAAVPTPPLVRQQAFTKPHGRQRRLLQSGRIVTRGRRRRLDTEILPVTTGKLGHVLQQQHEHQGALHLPAIVRVRAVPTGVTRNGREKKVLVRFNIIVERKVLNNLVPYSAWKMILEGAVCFLFAAFLFVRVLFRALSRGDDFAATNTNAAVAAALVEGNLGSEKLL